MRLGLLSALLLTGCASLTQPFPLNPVVESRGNNLVTVSVQPPEIIQQVCQHPKALACVTRRNDTGVTIFFRLPPAEWGIDQEELGYIVSTITHEFCHAVAGLQNRPDPCHDEDGGKLEIHSEKAPLRILPHLGCFRRGTEFFCTGWNEDRGFIPSAGQGQ